MNDILEHYRLKKYPDKTCCKIVEIVGNQNGIPLTMTWYALFSSPQAAIKHLESHLGRVLDDHEYKALMYSDGSPTND